MKHLNKVKLFFILITVLILPITSYAVTTTGANEIIKADIYYILAFDSNTSDPVENLPPSIEADVGETITIPNQIPTRTGYTFSNWNTMQDGSGASYQAGDQFANLYQDTILYAQWNENNSPIIIVIIPIILFLLILIGIIAFEIYYNVDNKNF